MREKMLDAIANDLFIVPSLVVRASRRKLLRTALACVDETITPLHFGIMKALSEAGPMCVTAVGDRLQVPAPQMTRLADRLVTAGLVQRQTDPSDRRTVNLTLTEKGTTLMKERDAAIKESLTEALSCLTDEELRRLSESLKSLRDTFSKLP